MIQRKGEDLPKGSLQRIWWLASYPKSGNTWIRAFISAYTTGACNINAISGVVGDLNDYFHQIVSPVPIDKMSLGEYLVVHPAALMHLARIQRDEPVLVIFLPVNCIMLRLCVRF